jgi:hypothetical protein
MDGPELLVWALRLVASGRHCTTYIERGAPCENPFLQRRCATTC